MRSSYSPRMGNRDDTSGAATLLGVIFYPLKLVVQVGLLGAAIATLAPLLAHQAPVLAFFESFRLQLGVGGAVLAVIGLLFRPRWMVLLGVLAAGWNLAILWPYLPAWRAPPA